MVRVSVQAHPGARLERIALGEHGVLSVWVRARAVDGQANAALVRAVADALGLRPRQVRVVVGQTARRKILEIDLPSLEAVRSRLLAHEMRSHQDDD